MNEKLAEEAQSHPPTLSQSKFLCHMLPHFCTSYPAYGLSNPPTHPF